jgi:hypothetical protein
LLRSSSLLPFSSLCFRISVLCCILLCLVFCCLSNCFIFYFVFSLSLSLFLPMFYLSLLDFSSSRSLSSICFLSFLCVRLSSVFPLSYCSSLLSLFLLRPLFQGVMFACTFGGAAGSSSPVLSHCRVGHAWV